MNKPITYGDLGLIIATVAFVLVFYLGYPLIYSSGYEKGVSDSSHAGYCDERYYLWSCYDSFGYLIATSSAFSTFLKQ